MKIANVRIDEVCAYLRMSKASIYEKGRPSSKYFDPSFPVRFKISQRAVAWDFEEIKAWLEQKKSARNSSTEH